MRTKLHTTVLYNSHPCCTMQKNAHPGTFVTHQTTPIIEVIVPQLFIIVVDCPAGMKASYCYVGIKDQAFWTARSRPDGLFETP